MSTQTRSVSYSKLARDSHGWILVALRSFLEFVNSKTSSVSIATVAHFAPSILKSSYKELIPSYCQIFTVSVLDRPLFVCTMLGSFWSSNRTKLWSQLNVWRLRKGQGTFFWVIAFLISVAYCQNTSDTDLAIFLI